MPYHVCEPNSNIAHCRTCGLGGVEGGRAGGVVGVEVQQELGGQAGHGGHSPVGPQCGTQGPCPMLQGHQAVLAVQRLSPHYALKDVTEWNITINYLLPLTTVDLSLLYSSHI